MRQNIKNLTFKPKFAKIGGTPTPKFYIFRKLQWRSTIPESLVSYLQKCLRYVAKHCTQCEVQKYRKLRSGVVLLCWILLHRTLDMLTKKFIQKTLSQH